MNPFTRLRSAFLVSLIVTAGCNVAVNEDIHVEAGSESRRGASSVNGDVVVAEKAVVRDGDLKTVNGTIEIKHGARVNRCATVNGSLKVEAEAETGDLESVNGHLEVERDAAVRGNVKLVNGESDSQGGRSRLG